MRRGDFKKLRELCFECGKLEVRTSDWILVKAYRDTETFNTTTTARGLFMGSGDPGSPNVVLCSDPDGNPHMFPFGTR